MISLVDLRKTFDESVATLASHVEESKRKSAELKAAADVAEREYILATKSDLDIERIRRAETIVRVRGLNNYGGGESPGALSDAISWFAGSLPYSPYKDLNSQYFGTKDYDRWTHQRTDCEYGMGPGHGSIVFAIELNRDFRGSGLTEDQRNDCIYYLEALRQGKLKTVAQAA